LEFTPRYTAARDELVTRLESLSLRHQDGAMAEERGRAACIPLQRHREGASS